MRSLLVAVLASISLYSSVLAQAPDSLSFQGVLTDTSGVTVADGNYNVFTRMYKGSSTIWEQNHVGVAVTDGVFSIILSGTTAYPLDTVAFNQPIDLGIAVNGGNEMTPRTPLTTAAFARGMPGLYTFYHVDGSNQSFNVVGGAANNVVGAGVTGATIGGGGDERIAGPNPNLVLENFATVSGGHGNTGGGLSSVVGGGVDNTASNFGSVVGGGLDNTASGWLSMVPGGAYNTAQGDFSFAGGTSAFVDHAGTFVWSGNAFDQYDTLASTGANQFLIRAEGGVGIGTNQPLSNSQLHVEHGSMGTNDWGVVVTNSSHSTHRMGMRLANDGFFEITNDADDSGPNFARLDNTGNWTAVSDRRLKTGIEPASDLLETALALEPVRYHFKNLSDQSQKSLGLIGQQAQDVVPSLVTEGELLTVNYAGLSVVAIGAIQNLYELVQEQQAEIDRLRLLVEAK